MSLPASLHWNDEELKIKASLENEELLELHDSVSRHDVGAKRDEATSLVKSLAKSMELEFENLVSDAQKIAGNRASVQHDVAELQHQAARLKLQRSAAENAMHERAELSLEIEAALSTKVCGIPLSTPKEDVKKESDLLISEIDELERAMEAATEEYQARKAMSEELERLARDLHERIETSYMQQAHNEG